MQLDKIEDVLSENLGEGYRIVRDNDELSPIIEWVDWVNQSENDENEEAIRVEVHFEDGTEETFEKGITLRQKTTATITKRKGEKSWDCLETFLSRCKES